MANMHCIASAEQKHAEEEEVDLDEVRKEEADLAGDDKGGVSFAAA